MEAIISPASVTASEAAAFAGKPAASWGAIVAGAFVAASSSLILVSLGSGIGFASMSPWAGKGATLTTFAITTAIWLIVTQWVSAALGGYIAGRLRARWVGTHTHEVFFRDTAHGLVTWSVATIILAAVAAGSVLSGASGGAKAAADVVSSASQAAMPYNIDKLLRSSNSVGTQDLRVEATHILTNAISTGSVPDVDRTYLADQVAARTAISQADAQSRVDSLISAVMDAQQRAKAEADTARKAAAEASIYLALSLLIGAFIASVAAAIGGKLRDEHI